MKITENGPLRRYWSAVMVSLRLSLGELASTTVNLTVGDRRESDLTRSFLVFGKFTDESILLSPIIRVSQRCSVQPIRNIEASPHV